MNYKNQLTQNNETLKNILSLIPTLPPETYIPEMATLTFLNDGGNIFSIPIIYYYNENYELVSTEGMSSDEFPMVLNLPLNSFFFLCGPEKCLNKTNYPEPYFINTSGILPIHEEKIVELFNYNGEGNSQTQVSFVLVYDTPNIKPKDNHLYTLVINGIKYKNIQCTKEEEGDSYGYYWYVNDDIEIHYSSEIFQIYMSEWGGNPDPSVTVQIYESEVDDRGLYLNTTYFGLYQVINSEANLNFASGYNENAEEDPI